MKHLAPILATMRNRGAVAFAVGAVAQITLITPLPDILPELESVFVEAILHTGTLVSMVVLAASRPIKWSDLFNRS